MAGFFDFNTIGRARDRFVEMSKFGMRWDDLMIKNSQAIGYIEGELRQRLGSSLTTDDLMKYSMAISDTTSKLRGKTLAFFQLDYLVKREKLKDLASNPEIEFVIDTISDDAIIYDKNSFFCIPADLKSNFVHMKGVKSDQIKLEYEDKVKELYYNAFDKIYHAWGFNDGQAAWRYFYQYLIEGFLAFEILYDDLHKPKNIIGFKELNPATITPVVRKDPAGKIYMEWIQRDEETGQFRTLADSQIIYMSYSNAFKTKRVSFVERMVRSFNLMRILEQSKVIWHVMYAPLRLKTEVPVGTKSLQKAKEDINEFVNAFKEDIFFDNESGELKVDGKPKMHFYKNYVVPVNAEGQKVNIEPFKYEGPNFEEDGILQYFFKKFKLDSKLPFSRWDYSEGGGAYTIGGDSVTREEIAYGKFIKRLRASFQELMMKPWYIQICMANDAIKNDYKFRNAMGIEYKNDNYFEEQQQQDILKKGVDAITALKGLKKDTPEDAIPTTWAIKRHLHLTEDDMQDIEATQKQAVKDAAAAAGGAPAAGGEAAGGAPGAAPAPGGEALPPTEEPGAAPEGAGEAAAMPPEGATETPA